MMIFMFRITVKTERAVAVACSDLLGSSVYVSLACTQNTNGQNDDSYRRYYSLTGVNRRTLFYVLSKAI